MNWPSGARGNPVLSRFPAPLPFFAALFGASLLLRFCHVGLLWADEDYHLAAALELLRGKLLYRTLWYDKPPLAALVYALLGAPTRWALRAFGAAYSLAICAALYRLCSGLWGRREGYLAAGLAAFFLHFDFAFAVIPLAPDFFMILPHTLAVREAWQGRPFRAGLWTGVAFLFHTKGVFVGASCAVLAWRGLPLLAGGFLVPTALGAAALAATGALGGYGNEVWKWGLAYSAGPGAADMLATGARRTLHWMGFHLTLVLGALGSDQRKKLAAWAAISLAGVAMGGQFFERYYFLLLPPLVVAAARGLALGLRPGAGAARKWLCAAAAVAALVPLVRFGPRYLMLAQGLSRGQEAAWSDVALDQDSRAVSAIVNQVKRPGDTLLVWGYRPSLYVYTQLPAGTPWPDSQPLTGVPADRHFATSTPVLPAWAAAHRAELESLRPTFIVDSLSGANPALAPARYPELTVWWAAYAPIATTRSSIIYRLR